MPARARRPTRVAWVESPLQLVNSVEHAAHTGEPLHVWVRPGLVGLDAVIARLSPHLPAHVTVEHATTRRGLADLSVAHRRLAGDAYSGQVRAVLSATGARDLVVVDDGSMTLALATQLATRSPLSRPGQLESRVMSSLGAMAASRVRRGARRGHVALFTAFHDHPAVAALEQVGVRLLPNGYGWLRSIGLESPVRARQVLLGTALAEDGLVDAEAYFAWVRATAAAAPDGVDYLPHRRESAESLARVQGIPGVRVVDAGLPAELTLASAAHLESVEMLPSTAAVTLRALLRTETELRVRAVPDSWWTSRADPHLRAMLADLIGEQR